MGKFHVVLATFGVAVLAWAVMLYGLQQRSDVACVIGWFLIFFVLVSPMWRKTKN
jgi:apolipoprotein N-acyltransferase